MIKRAVLAAVLAAIFVFGTFAWAAQESNDICDKSAQNQRMLEFAPGNESMKTPDGQYAFKMSDGNYYTIDKKTGEAVLYIQGEGR